MAFLGPIVERTAQAHGAGVGLFQAGIGIGSVLGLLLGGRLADGRRSAHAIPVLLGFVAITQLVLASIHSIVHESMLASALLATTIVGGAIALFALMPLVQSGLVSAAPDRRSVVLALNGSMVFLGQGLGALAGGLAANFNGVDATGVVGAAIAASAAVCAIVILRGRDATPTRSSAPLPEGIGS
jgi:DHA1 family inner membrane transport protein